MRITTQWSHASWKKKKKNKLVAIFSFLSRSMSKEITITANLIPNINVSLSRIARPSKKPILYPATNTRI